MNDLKRCITYACSIFLLVGLSGTLSQTFGQNLIAHWTFDEGSGTTASSEVNSPATDGVFKTSPNDPSWELTNIAPIPGNVAALHLDSDVGAFDAVALDPAAVQPTGGFTIAGWINVESTAGGCPAGKQVLFIGEDTFTNPSIGSFIRLSIFSGTNPQAGQVFSSVRDIDGSFVIVTDPNPVTFNQWVHYAATFNSMTAELKLFRNGTEVDSQTMGGNGFDGLTQPPIPGGYAAEIGDDSSCAGALPGFVDDLAIWDAPLSGSQIDDIINGGVSGPLQVSIDIKPGSDENCLNINGNGVIPVAILGSTDFDVTQIDVSSLNFAGLDVRVRGNGNPQCSINDVSGDFTNPEGTPDGHDDLVCQFVDDPSNWSPDNGTAKLTGALLDSTLFEGSDNICIVP